MHCQRDTTKAKPVNLFYVWYTELCRRLNSAPATVVKPAKPKCHTVLDFVADRLKVEEWHPIINALKHDTSLHVIAIKSRIGNCQFLHDIDTEDKLRQMKRRGGSLWTAYIVKSLLKSLSCSIRNTEVLSCLEFDGIPIFSEYLEPLLKALQKNKTLKTLSLSRCPIKDIGCQMVCAYLRFTPNIEILNLSDCGLNGESGEYIAKLIKYQQINRFCETWHKSLRYSEPDIHIMRGLKRITLNRNSCFGDDGLEFILNELPDDLWIKALDLQKCGLTNNIAERLLDIVQYNQSLEIVDLRLNDEINLVVIEQLLMILQDKLNGRTSEYQWCNTAITLTCDSVLETISNCTINKSVQKAKSVPLKTSFSKMNINKPVRRTKSVPDKQTNTSEKFEKRLCELQNKLEEERSLREETQRTNIELLKQLEQISNVTNSSQQEIKIDSSIRMVNAISHENGDNNGSFPQSHIVIENSSILTPSQLLQKMCQTNGVKHQNGITKQSNVILKKSNGTVCDLYRTVGKPSQILQKLVGSDNDNDDSDIESLLSYVENETTAKMNTSIAERVVPFSKISLPKIIMDKKISSITNRCVNGNQVSNIM